MEKTLLTKTTPSTHQGPDEINASVRSPVRVVELDIAEAIPEISLVNPPTGKHYPHVLCLVRAHTRPIGTVELRSEQDAIPADECAKLVWGSLIDQILNHLWENNLQPVMDLTAGGLPRTGVPRFLEGRQRILEGAPFVSVVIATRDRPEKIERCLRSFSKVIYPCYEVIVVDNAPTTPATEKVVERLSLEMHTLRYVREQRPGLARARNCGLANARGQIVAFTDDDVIPDPYWIAEIIRGFSFGPRVVCVTGLIFPLELETPSQVWIEQFGGFSKGFTRRVYDLENNRLADRLYPYSAGAFGSGGNLAFKTDFLRSFGGFDPALGAGTPAMAGEELAIFVQILQRGHQIAYEPGALIFHQHHREFTELKRQIYGYGVGLTAYVMKCLVDDPRLVKDIGGKFFSGLSYAFDPRSPKNRAKGKDYPAELTRLELLGMLYGPFAYLYSRCRSG